VQTKMGVSSKASRSSCSTAAERSSYSAGKTVFTECQHLRRASECGVVKEEGMRQAEKK
jgi:hypothetical protein